LASFAASPRRELGKCWTASLHGSYHLSRFSKRPLQGEPCKRRLENHWGLRACRLRKPAFDLPSESESGTRAYDRTLTYGSDCSRSNSPRLPKPPGCPSEPPETFTIRLSLAARATGMPRNSRGLVAISSILIELCPILDERSCTDVRKANDLRDKSERMRRFRQLSNLASDRA